MKRRLLLILLFGLVLGTLTGIQPRQETTSFTAKQAARLYTQMTNTPVEARDVYFVERLSGHYAVAYLEANHDRLFLLIRKPTNPSGLIESFARNRRWRRIGSKVAC